MFYSGNFRLSERAFNRHFKKMRSPLYGGDVELLEFGGEEDHIHLLIKAHPSLELSVLVGNFKTVTSRLVRTRFKEHLSGYYWKPVLWSRAYCILSTGGATIETIKKYIESQKIDDGDRRFKKTKAQFISPDRLCLSVSKFRNGPMAQSFSMRF